MKTRNRWLLVPIAGILLFLFLFVFAASRYPGGSQADLTHEGFDWVHNYWCNLMGKEAMNGEPNDAVRIAIPAFVVLCGSLALFFYHFSKQLARNSIWAKIIRIGGVLSMSAAALIATPWHDEMTIIASFFGVFVVAGVIIGVSTSHFRLYKWTGIFCLFLLGLNNYIYYTQHGLVILPVLQKLTFVIVLCWIVGLNWQLYQNVHVTS